MVAFRIGPIQMATLDDDAFATRAAASGMCTAVAIEQFIADIEIVSVTASASITCHRSPD